MGMHDPRPTSSYFVEKLKESSNFAYIHVIEPRVGGGSDRDMQYGEVRNPFLKIPFHDFDSVGELQAISPCRRLYCRDWSDGGRGKRRLDRICASVPCERTCSSGCVLLLIANRVAYSPTSQGGFDAITHSFTETVKHITSERTRGAILIILSRTKHSMSSDRVLYFTKFRLYIMQLTKKYPRKITLSRPTSLLLTFHWKKTNRVSSSYNRK